MENLMHVFLYTVNAWLERVASTQYNPISSFQLICESFAQSITPPHKYNTGVLKERTKSKACELRARVCGCVGVCVSACVGLFVDLDVSKYLHTFPELIKKS